MFYTKCIKSSFWYDLGSELLPLDIFIAPVVNIHTYTHTHTFLLTSHLSKEDVRKTYRGASQAQQTSVIHSKYVDE